MKPRWKHHLSDSSTFAGRFRGLDVWVNESTIQLRFEESSGQVYVSYVIGLRDWIKTHHLQDSHPYPYLMEAYAFGLEFLERKDDPSISPNARS